MKGINKTLKKFVVLFLAFVFALSVVGLVACNTKKDDPKPDGSDWGVYFPIPKMNSDKKLLVIGSEIDEVSEAETRNLLVTLSAIQGLANSEEVTMYLNYKLLKDGQYPNDYWLQDIVDNYGVTTENLTVAQAIEHYKKEQGENAGYVTYSIAYDPVVGTDETRSLTAAINICAIRGWIPVEKSLKEEAENQWGLTEKYDATEKTDKDIFEEFKDEFDNSILIQQRPMENKDYGLALVSLRDYAIANKFFTFYDDGLGQTAATYRKAVHSWANPNKPILGWGPGNEGEHISYASEAGQFPVPSDYSYNLSVMSADIFQEGEIKQKNQFESITPEEGKHYVAIGRSDGDNITTWQTEFRHSLTDYGSTERENGDFAMAWSISPMLAEIFPSLLRNVYRTASNYDYFIAPVSGHAYMYPTVYPDKYKDDYFEKFDQFLEKADLNSVCILDHGQDVILKKDIANYYASAENLIGGFCFNGHNYKGGNGAVVWSDNGKPFVAPKESLWQEQPGEVVARIGTYYRDYTRIEGYTYINLHPWSHTYQDVQYVVEELSKNPDIVVVSPDQLLDMIAKYVPHVDVTNPQNVDPNLDYIVPADQLNNKFLEGSGTEDWAAYSGNINRVTVRVGGALGDLNGLRINGIGEKIYTIPDEPNMQIAFDYLKQQNNTAVKVELEIDGVTKVIFDRLPVKATDGVSNIVIPVWNYFSQQEYGGKEAKLRVEVLDNIEDGVIISNVKTFAATIVDASSAGDKLNDSNFKNTEDWIYSTFAKNANVAIDNSRIMLDGSDGWTGFFDDNININIYKTFTIPTELSQAEVSLKLAVSNTGTAVNVFLVVDGTVYNLSEGFITLLKSDTKIFNAVIDGKGGKNAQILVMQRDSRQNNGIGECAYIVEFKVGASEIDPYYNTFAGSLEDWTEISNAVAEQGVAKITANGYMSKTITLPEIADNYSTVFSFIVKSQSADNLATVTLKAEYDGQAYTLKTMQAGVDATTLEWTELDAFNPAMSGKEVKLTIEVSGANAVAIVDDFKVTSKKNPDMYNNTFESDLEDWQLESTAGWTDGNGITCANSRMEVSLNGFGQITDAYEAVAKKKYTLPDSEDITISFTASAPAGYNEMPQGGSVTMTIEIGGTEYTLLDHETVNTENAFPSAITLSVNLAEIVALDGVDYVNKTVILRLKFNDEGYAGGVGVMIYVDNFATTVSDDKLMDTFDSDLEDWTQESKAGWDGNGAKWANERMEVDLNHYGQVNPEFEVVVSKTYTLPDSEDIIISFTASAPAGYNEMPQGGSVTMTIEIDGTEYTLLDHETVNTENAFPSAITLSAKLAEIAALEGVEYAGKEVTVRLKFNDEGYASGVGVMIYVDNFATTIDNNKLSNTFDADLEDWTQESKAGWDGNGAKWANERMEVDLNHYGTVNPEFEVVVSKTYNLPDSENISISFTASAPGGYNEMPQGGSVTMTIEIDGTEYTLLDHETVNTENAFPSAITLSANLAEIAALEGVEYAGKSVTVRLKFNDEGYASGVGVMIYIDNFETIVA